jgi:hypothetical protein
MSPPLARASAIVAYEAVTTSLSRQPDNVAAMTAAAINATLEDSALAINTGQRPASAHSA